MKSKKLILAKFAGFAAAMLIATPSFANIASTTYVDREVASRAATQGAGTPDVVATVNASGQYVRSATALTDLVTSDGLQEALDDAVGSVNTSVANKADKQGVGADGVVATVNAAGQYIRSETALTDVATKSGDIATINGALGTKADKATTLSGYGITDAYTKTETYTQAEVNSAISTATGDIANKADLQEAGTAGEVATVDAAGQYIRSGIVASSLASQADVATATTDMATQTWVGSQNYLTDNDIADKADRATTLAGYGITDAYTTSETYNKTEVDGYINAQIPRPLAACSDAVNKCLLATDGSTFTWEVVAR